jgi:hypothetical protein
MADTRTSPTQKDRAAAEGDGCPANRAAMGGRSLIGRDLREFHHATSSDCGWANEGSGQISGRSSCLGIPVIRSTSGNLSAGTLVHIETAPLLRPNSRANRDIKPRLALNKETPFSMAGI